MERIKEGLVTIGDLRKTKKRENSPQEEEGTERFKEKKKFKKKRQIRWNTNNHYKCIKEGLEMSNVETINELTQPTEDMFFIYKNTHACASRDNDVPLYEAVYKCQDGSLIRVQKKHLKIAYNQSNKRDVKRAWDVSGEGIPYWVDRFVYSKIKK